jgi:WD40 repeat protein
MVNAQRLVFEQAHKPAQPALVPDKVCLTPPGGPIQHTITAHTSFSNVYLTRDRKRILSASYDGTLKIFDARFGHMIRSTEGVEEMTKHFRVDVTEEYGVTSGSGVIQVWKINTGQRLHQFRSSPNISPIGLINDDVVAILEGRLEVNNFRTGAEQIRSFNDPRLVFIQTISEF